MARRSDTLETTLLAIELLRRIPRSGKISATELQRQLAEAGFERDLRSIQRTLKQFAGISTSNATTTAASPTAIASCRMPKGWPSPT